MKKLFGVLLAASFLVISAGCAASRATSTPPPDQKPKDTEEIWTRADPSAISPSSQAPQYVSSDIAVSESD